MEAHGLRRFALEEADAAVIQLAVVQAFDAIVQQVNEFHVRIHQVQHLHGCFGVFAGVGDGPGLLGNIAGDHDMGTGVQGDHFHAVGGSLTGHHVQFGLDKVARAGAGGDSRLTGISVRGSVQIEVARFVPFMHELAVSAILVSGEDIDDFSVHVGADPQQAAAGSVSAQVVHRVHHFKVRHSVAAARKVNGVQGGDFFRFGQEFRHVFHGQVVKLGPARRVHNFLHDAQTIDGTVLFQARNTVEGISHQAAGDSVGHFFLDALAILIQQVIQLEEHVLIHQGKEIWTVGAYNQVQLCVGADHQRHLLGGVHEAQRI